MRLLRAQNNDDFEP